MPVMDIPRHTAWEVSAATTWIEQTVIPLLKDGHRFIKVANAPETNLGNRFTRVPFLKIIVSGALLLPCEDGVVERINGQGTALFFHPETLVALRFPAPCSFLRITFEADGLFIGQ